MFLVVLLLFFTVILLDSQTLLKKAGKRINAVYYVAIGIGFVVLTLYSLDVSVPSPTPMITKVLDAMFHIGNNVDYR